MDKHDLRIAAKERILSLEGRDKESLLIAERMRSLKEFREAETILSFYPLPDEPDIRIEGKRVLYPFLLPERRMGFGEGLHSVNRYGIPEPERIAAEYGKAFMIVPLLGYSRDLARLGRGAGYYDRYIAENRSRLITAGAAFSVSFLEDFIPEPHDARLDMVITPYSVLRSAGI